MRSFLFALSLLLLSVSNTPAISQSVSSENLSVEDMEAALGLSKSVTRPGPSSVPRFRAPSFEIESPAAGEPTAAPPVGVGGSSNSFSLPIQFEFGSSLIQSAYRPLVQRVAEVLIRNPSVRLMVRGHSDSIGAAEANRMLSLQRAKAIREALTALGVPSARVTADGRGERDTLPGIDPENPRNRRVEFIRQGAD